jgi:hypothetical protein
VFLKIEAQGAHEKDMKEQKEIPKKLSMAQQSLTTKPKYPLWSLAAFRFLTKLLALSFI